MAENTQVTPYSVVEYASRPDLVPPSTLALLDAYLAGVANQTASQPASLPSRPHRQCPVRIWCDLDLRSMRLSGRVLPQSSPSV